MKKMKKRNGGMVGMGAYEPMHMSHGGMSEVPMEWGRKKLDGGTEQLIQGTEFQVRGRYFNNNDGKGTF